MPGMTHLCEDCHRDTELTHCRSVDAYLCEECITVRAELYFAGRLATTVPEIDDTTTTDDGYTGL